jgi:hypothetical protein
MQAEASTLLATCLDRFLNELDEPEAQIDTDVWQAIDAMVSNAAILKVDVPQHHGLWKTLLNGTSTNSVTASMWSERKGEMLTTAQLLVVKRGVSFLLGAQSARNLQSFESYLNQVFNVANELHQKTVVLPPDQIKELFNLLRARRNDRFEQAVTICERASSMGELFEAQQVFNEAAWLGHNAGIVKFWAVVQKIRAEVAEKAGLPIAQVTLPQIKLTIANSQGEVLGTLTASQGAALNRLEPGLPADAPTNVNWLAPTSHLQEIDGLLAGALSREDLPAITGAISVQLGKAASALNWEKTQTFWADAEVHLNAARDRIAEEMRRPLTALSLPGAVEGIDHNSTDQILKAANALVFDFEHAQSSIDGGFQLLATALKKLRTALMDAAHETSVPEDLLQYASDIMSALSLEEALGTFEKAQDLRRTSSAVTGQSLHGFLQGALDVQAGVASVHRALRQLVQEPEWPMLLDVPELSWVRNQQIQVFERMQAQIAQTPENIDFGLVAENIRRMLDTSSSIGGSVGWNESMSFLRKNEPAIRAWIADQ